MDLIRSYGSEDEQPRKSRKHKAYSSEWKLQVIKCANQVSKKAASKKFNISRGSVQDWVEQENKLKQLKEFSTDGKSRKRLRAGGRPLVFEDLDTQLAAWKFCSIVLLAIADAESRFLMMDVGASGRNSDSTLWIQAPPPPKLRNEEGSLPFIFLGDGGFGCTDLYILGPDSFTDRGANSQEKIAFNGRLSRARSAVEHAFGIFAKRWRIFLGTIEARPETARLYTLAAVILHNFLRDPVEEENLNLRFPDDRRMLIDQRAPEAGRQGR
uniref:DDE Tnp4 domain-containing protein n=1 Tax=Ditylenchus dipsaci TaxID=166011 RepID=A0A915EHG1_9BILA